jgi:hypothetical protein
MAYYFIFPEKDTTLYSHPDRSDMNAGSDEILEITKEQGSTDNYLYPSRILVQFSNDDIKGAIESMGHDVFNRSDSAGPITASLQLTSAEPKNLVHILNVHAYAVSQSWREGTGRYSNLPTSSNGATWIHRDNDTTATKWITSSFQIFSTGSISSSGVQLTQGGGVWYTGSGFEYAQQFLTGDSLDTSFNIKDTVKKWSASLYSESTYPDGIPNYGIILKKPNNVEANTSSSFGELQYFSVDTHTIHPPKLAFIWDDSTHTYQASAKTSGDLQVSLYRNKEQYNQNDIATFRIHVRDKYPTRRFTTTSNQLDKGYFTTSSYYSIRDAHTEQEVIPFDDKNTKLSADSNGMYFKVYMKGLQPERYYRVLFKHKNNDGTTIYDNDYYFKVVR